MTSASALKLSVYMAYPYSHAEYRYDFGEGDGVCEIMVNRAY
jgi:hypothetical protein